MRSNSLRRRNYHQANNIYPNRYLYIYIGPSVLLLVGLCLFPLLVLIYNSFTDLSLISKETHFVGFDNFVNLVTSAAFWNNFKTTLVYVFFAVSLEMILGFILALLFQIKLPFKRVFRTLIILPMVTAPVAMSFLWSIIYNPKMGILNYLLSLLNLPPQLWASDPKTALFSIILVDIWMNTPFVFLILASGMAALPNDLFEAGMVDGMNFFQGMRKILYPLLSPVIFITFLFRLVDTFKVFDLIFVLTGGGPGTATETVNISIYKTAFHYSKIGPASAQALLLYVLVFIMSIYIVKRGNISFSNKGD